MKKFKDVDSYIENAEPDARPHLEGLRKLIKAILPKAEEKIWYGVPFYDYAGFECVGFDAFKKHVNFGFGGGVLEDADRKKLEVAGYKLGKMTMCIKFDQKIPEAVIKKILKAKAKINEGKRDAKTKPR